MFDLKTMHSALAQLEEERGIPKEKVLEAVEMALATAYKKDYGKKGQIIRAKLDANIGTVEFDQVKIVVDESMLKDPLEEGAEGDDAPAAAADHVEGAASLVPEKVYFNEEHHIMLADAQKIRKGAKVGDELIFPLEVKDDFGRIAAQTAKQVIIQRIREAERGAVIGEYGKRQGEIVSGKVQRVERGTLFVDLGRTTGILPREEQIPGEHFGQGERIRAYLFSVEDTPRGVNVRMSRSHPQFVAKLFEVETPEIAEGTVTIESIAREPGSRTKIAVASKDPNIDPVGSCVGQRGVRVSTVISELGGEKIDVIEFSLKADEYISSALSPAKISRIELRSESKEATVFVDEDQFSLAIGKGGQNVRLAARLTGWKIDIRSTAAPKPEATPEKEIPEEGTASIDEAAS
ncbi:MAG: transcription termination factor NusA [Patescibacteria group bacterium]